MITVVRVTFKVRFLMELYRNSQWNQNQIPLKNYMLCKVTHCPHSQLSGDKRVGRQEARVEEERIFKVRN